MSAPTPAHHTDLPPDLLPLRELMDEAACRLGDALVAQWLEALVRQGLNLRLLDTLALCNATTHARVEAAIRRLPDAEQPALLTLLASIQPAAGSSPTLH